MVQIRTENEMDQKKSNKTVTPRFPRVFWLKTRSVCRTSNSVPLQRLSFRVLANLSSAELLRKFMSILFLCKHNSMLLTKSDTGTTQTIFFPCNWIWLCFIICLFWLQIPKFGQTLYTVHFVSYLYRFVCLSANEHFWAPTLCQDLAENSDSTFLLGVREQQWLEIIIIIYL